MCEEFLLQIGIVTKKRTNSSFQEASTPFSDCCDRLIYGRTYQRQQQINKAKANRYFQDGQTKHYEPPSRYKWSSRCKHSRNYLAAAIETVMEQSDVQLVRKCSNLSRSGFNQTGRSVTDKQI